MPNKNGTKKKRESLFLNEHFMAAQCALVVATGMASLFFRLNEEGPLGVFELVAKLVTAVAMFFAFKRFRWDVTKGLMGGVLFSLMYQEAHLVLGRLWGAQDFDTYLVVGLQGSLYLATAGMAFLMTVIITINHFFINYSAHGNEKNVILNRIAIAFKIVVYICLLATNGMLGLSSAVLWNNALQYLMDIALLLLLATVETQFDTFNAVLHDLRQEKRRRRRDA